MRNPSIRGQQSIFSGKNYRFAAIARGFTARPAGLPWISVLAGGPLGHALRSHPQPILLPAVIDTLFDAGLPLAAARFFAEAICSGSVLVAVHCADSAVRDARDILDEHSDVPVTH